MGFAGVFTVPAGRRGLTGLTGRPQVLVGLVGL